MTMETAQSAVQSGGKPSGGAPSLSVFALWRDNVELTLAAITLVALLIGWIGGSVTGLLPQWAVTVFAVIAFGAGGYSGLKGAIEEAKEGRLDIDFLMIAAALARDRRVGRRGVAALPHAERRARGVRHGPYAQGHRGAGNLRPEVALVRRNGAEVSVPVEDLRVSEIVLVRPGERLPVDGAVVRAQVRLTKAPSRRACRCLRRSRSDYAGDQRRRRWRSKSASRRRKAP